MKITKLPESKTVWAEFDSVNDLMSAKYDESKLISSEYSLKNIMDFDKLGGQDKWAYGQYSKEESYNMITKGYLNEKASKAYEKARNNAGAKDSDTYNIAPVARRRRRRNEYEGEICIDSYLAGSTDYYRKVSKVKTQDRIVRVIINVTYNGSTSAERFMEYNIKAINSVEKMLREGKIVEVYGAFTGLGAFEDQNFKNAMILTKIKEADRGQDLHRMRSACLISFARIAMFRAPQLVAAELGISISRGLGQAIYTSQNEGQLNKFIKEAAKQMQSEVVFFDGASEKGINGVSSKNL